MCHDRLPLLHDDPGDDSHQPPGGMTTYRYRWTTLAIPVIHHVT